MNNEVESRFVAAIESLLEDAGIEYELTHIMYTAIFEFSNEEDQEVFDEIHLDFIRNNQC